MLEIFKNKILGEKITPIEEKVSGTFVRFWRLRGTGLWLRRRHSVRTRERGCPGEGRHLTLLWGMMWPYQDPGKDGKQVGR